MKYGTNIPANRLMNWHREMAQDKLPETQEMKKNPDFTRRWKGSNLQLGRLVPDRFVTVLPLKQF